ncbi:hypothetical protein [Enterococcus casseliflavus]|uniref:hypothetical protein n=1 Tax=Enterococcus casseliflavus TaxID=37734 RepID=UPI002543416C|nr:hypothetical protein [Enterococcus casseliflavus]MDK4448989.1 hypothetical protein [Enterococcus casseliflavus]
MSTKLENYKLAKMIKDKSVYYDLIDAVDNHERFRNSYFWSSPSSAYARRKYEEDNSRIYEIELIDGGILEINQDVSCTCANLYYKMYVELKNTKLNIYDLNKSTLNGLIKFLEPQINCKNESLQALDNMINKDIIGGKVA